ncbi:hypothetical protein LCGC14_2329160 [marine sediment metagenome]|uniref:Uncharacterized protein n=1 Tax=marine sediment metagenome TaxID=412755 RepID=A0A0F9CFC8_9ZZZZ
MEVTREATKKFVDVMRMQANITQEQNESITIIRVMLTALANRVEMLEHRIEQLESEDE